MVLSPVVVDEMHLSPIVNNCQVNLLPSITAQANFPGPRVNIRRHQLCPRVLVQRHVLYENGGLPTQLIVKHFVLTASAIQYIAAIVVVQCRVQGGRAKGHILES